MNCDQTGAHLLDRFDDALDEATATELDEHLGECTACRREAQELEELWVLLGQFGEARANETMRSRFFAMLASHDREAGSAPEARPHTRDSAHNGGRLLAWLDSWWPRRPALQAGMALAALVLGLLLGPHLTTGGVDRREVDDLRAEMQAMTHAVTLSLLQHQSASERLRAVGLSQQSASDADITRALLDTLNNDPSVNVRLAALDVLSGMLQRPEVHNGLLEALQRQESPTMQVALAHVLAVADGPRSRSAIERVLENEEVPDPIRERLRGVLSEGRDAT
jgi:hypothetical protein